MTDVAIRPLEAADRRALEYAFAHLSERSRYQRFLGCKPRLLDRDLDRLCAVDHWHHHAVIAWSKHPRRPLGVARYVRGERFDSAELAVAVDDAWQRRGLGSALVSELAQHAHAAGVRSFSASLLGENAGALRLAARLGRTRLRAHAGDYIEIEIQGIGTRD